MAVDSSLVLLPRASRYGLRVIAAAASLAWAVGCASEVRYLDAGRALLEQKQYEAAIEQFMLALEANPTSTDANLNLGLVYLGLKRYDEAIKAIEQARAGKDSEEVRVALSMVYYQKGELPKAAALMEEALTIAPDRALNHLRLGIIRKEAGDLERAVEAFRMAMSQDPELVDARVNLGLTLKELKRYDEALEVLKDTVKDVRGVGSDVSGVQSALGEVYEAMSMLDYSVHSYKLALKYNDKSSAAYAGLGRVLRAQGRCEEAIELLTQGSSRVANDPAITLELGLTFHEFRLEPQAVKALLHAVELNPKQTGAYAPLLGLLEKHGPADTLFKALKLASTSLPDDIAIQIRAGKVARERKDYELAVEALKRAIDIEPANIEVNLNLGLAQAELGDFDAATETLATLKYLDAQKAEQLAGTIDKLRAAAAAEAQEEDRAKSKKVKRKPKRRRR